MEKTKELIEAYREHKITRAKFCREWAAMQGFNNAMKGAGDKRGFYYEYRGRRAKIEKKYLMWRESNGRIYKVKDTKTLRIIIDTIELKKTA